MYAKGILKDRVLWSTVAWVIYSHTANTVIVRESAIRRNMDYLVYWNKYSHDVLVNRNHDRFWLQLI